MAEWLVSRLAEKKVLMMDVALVAVKGALMVDILVVRWGVYDLVELMVEKMENGSAASMADYLEIYRAVL